MRECALLTRGGADNRYVSASAAIACHCFTALASYMPPQALLLPAAKPNTHTFFLVFSVTVCQILRIAPRSAPEPESRIDASFIAKTLTRLDRMKQTRQKEQLG